MYLARVKTTLTVQEHDLMCGVHVQTVSEWEGRVVVVEGPVRRGVVHFDASLSESCNKLLNPTDPLDTSNW